MNNSKNNVVAYVLVGVAALSVGFVTFVEFSKGPSDDTMTAAVSNAIPKSPVTAVSNTVAPKLLTGGACSPVGSTQTEKQTRSDGSTLTTTYTCMACMSLNAFGPKDKSLIPTSVVQSTPGMMCGNKIETYNRTETEGWIIDKFHQCKQTTDNVVEMQKTENPATTVTCNSNTCPVVPIDTKLACTVTTKALTTLTYTTPGAIPPGGQSGYQATMLTDESISDTGCPSPTRKVVPTCSVGGDTSYFNLSCPPTPKVMKATPAAATPPASCPGPYPKSAAAPNLVNKFSTVVKSIFVK